MTISELYELFIHHPVVTTDSRNCPNILRPERGEIRREPIRQAGVGGWMQLCDY